MNTNESPHLKNPPWTREELILALDVYFRFPTTNKNHPEIHRLSDLLNSLPIHTQTDREHNFRNPSGVYMKLMNFRHLDPNHSGEGLKSISRLDRVVWEEFSGDKNELSHTAEAIKRAYWAGEAKTTFSDEQIDDYEFPEGRILQKMHLVRERNQKLVREKKKAAIGDYGRLICEICGFDFAEKYGAIGENFIECHHLVPLSRIKAGSKTRLSDLALVCSNCHRMLHRTRPWLSIDDLKSKYEMASL